METPEIFIRIHYALMLAMAKAKGLSESKTSEWMDATANAGAAAWRICQWHHEGKSWEEIALQIVSRLEALKCGDAPEGFGTFLDN